MSLYKQLTLLIVTLFLLIFVGGYWLNFSSTQAFLNRQMQSQVQDAATALGLTLAPYLEQQNVSGVQTAVNAIFDRGFYQEISVYDLNNEEVATREQGVVIEDVPNWFVNAVDLSSPSAEQELSSGWSLAGKVVVASNPGYAYQQLWSVVSNSFYAYLTVFLLLLAGGYVTLHYLMRPLEALVRQAKAICNRQFDLELPIPRVPEFATVVLAMNQMAASVKASFTEFSQTVAQLREQAYQDPVTGLGNKRYFQTQLQHLIENKSTGRENEFTPGSLFLIQLNDFKGFNARAGYEKGDELLQAVGEVLSSCTASDNTAALCRLNGGDFAFFLADGNEVAADRLADKVASALAALANSKHYDGPLVAKIGIATIHKPMAYGSAMSQADSALRVAQSKRSTLWIRASELDASEIHSMTRQEWNSYVADRVESGEISFLAQKVVDNQDGDALLHREVFLQMSDKSGDSIPAGRLISTIDELKLSAEVDRQVITGLIKHVANDGASDRYAINLSAYTVCQTGFVDWLKTEISRYDPASQQIAQRLCFEFPESAVLNNLESIKEFAAIAKSIGCEIGVDQFGKAFSDFSYLNSLRPGYVKIDRAYTHELLQDQDSQFFVSSLCGICRSLDITFIAQAIETEGQAKVLGAAGVRGFQGYSIERPVAL